MKSSIKVIIFPMMIALFSACTSTKKVVYFNNLPEDQVKVSLPATVFEEPIIQPKDILNVTVSTLDPKATEGINQPIVHPALGSSSYALIGNQQVAGYTVDNEGDIHLNYIGRIHVGGLTIDEARAQIQSKVSHYFKDPVVNVTYVNFKISVLGEVNRPGVYVFPNPKVSVLDALGMAGDLSIYGKRENVLLIRSKSGTPSAEKEYIRINMNSTELMQSPYFYLRQGDVLYVSPTSGRVAANNTDRMQLVSIVSSVTSSVALVVTVILNASRRN